MRPAISRVAGQHAISPLTDAVEKGVEIVAER